MKRKKLVLEELRVDSFSVLPEMEDRRGTVRGNELTSSTWDTMRDCPSAHHTDCSACPGCLDNTIG